MNLIEFWFLFCISFCATSNGDDILVLDEHTKTEKYPRAYMRTAATDNFRALRSRFQHRIFSANEEIEELLHEIHTISQAIHATMQKFSALQVSKQHKIRPILLALKRHHPDVFRKFVRFPECREIDTGSKFYKDVAYIYQCILLKIGIPEELVKLIIKQIPRLYKPEDLFPDDILDGLAKIGVYLYTHPSEKGGPYGQINEALQRDNLEMMKQLDAFFGLILCGFRHLFFKRTPECVVTPSNHINQ